MEIATKVLPNIWIGNSLAAEKESFFEKEKIKAVINMTPTIPNFFAYDTSIEYIRIPVFDTKNKRNQEQMYEYFPIITEYIYKNVILEDKNLLIHCNSSQQRACVAVSSYLIKYYSMNPSDTVDLLVRKKKDAFNGDKTVNFAKALNKWYLKLN
jgi:protein-tyrosine phosphatase